MNHFQQILGLLLEKANNIVEQGRYFEQMAAFFLRNDPLYKERFTAVYTWAEWRAKRNEDQNDIGIDIVAEELDGDKTKYWAIQAKCYAENTTIDKKDIDTFFSASGKNPFTNRMVISTTEKWGKNAEETLRDQQIPCIRRGKGDLQDSPIWEKFLDPKSKVKAPKKTEWPHQKEARSKVMAGLKKADRGRLIMACGTGKTFTALKIAESMVSLGGSVLFLMPSLSLLSQALREWSTDTTLPLRNFVVCSDSKVGRERENEDIWRHDLALPATTDHRILAEKLKKPFQKGTERINVVFSTYHSLDVIAQAQKKGAPEFNLVICDEAHRTTGVDALDKKEESYFTAIHNPDYIRAKKRLYMTATPRIYSTESKAKAKHHDVEVHSMDDPQKYGEELYRLGFSEAVQKDLLSDYKVMVLAVSEEQIAKTMQNTLAQNGDLTVGDAAKLVGCWNGLAKRFTPSDNAADDDRTPMRRAVAFTQRIKDSRQVEAEFNNIVQEYSNRFSDTGQLMCEVKHVDGTMNAQVRAKKLRWLKETPAEADPSKYDTDNNYCRILSNARCLSEGVDVPALDAVIFLNPRKSQVDVVQAVGRVMRKAPDKQWGYVILPVVIPAGVSPEESLDDNKSYKVVWQVLQALRAHDERFNAMINQIELNKSKPDNIQVIGVAFNDPPGQYTRETPKITPTLPFPQFEEYRDAIFAKIVLKCGNRRYWEDWARDVGKIAQTNITRIRALLNDSGKDYRELFDEFLEKLRENLNPAISEDDAIEMLSQHLITRPVFEALFENYPFAEKNPVSKTMQAMLDLLDKKGLEAETKELQGFYDSVRERAKGIDNAAGKQKIMLELYDKFFATAFKKDSERLGIVYTPVEVVDFILHSADVALKKEFGKGLSDKDVHILDPFTGTGTFIARLLQSDIIKDKDLKRKYASELHANEIVLLAYYIAAVNIEEIYHHRSGEDYKTFDGIVLTDTFQLSEKGQADLDEIFPDNSARAKKQRKAPIRVIVGNPPYSAGQGSANDNNQNIEYPVLDKKITDTYAALSDATNKNSLYDSYIRAIRWATDRIGDEGVIAFVTNGSFIDGNAAAGVRKSMLKDFSAIYCFNLRGNARTSGEQRRMEKDNVFGQGTRTPVAITLLIKKKGNNKDATLHYYYIRDYKNRQEKLEIISDAKEYDSLDWQIIKPNPAGDWINQRDPIFQTYLPLGDMGNKTKTMTVPSIFTWYGAGVKTNKDAWVYNYSRQTVAKQMKAMIAFYNSQVSDYQKAKRKEPSLIVDNFINNDQQKISWDRELKNDLAKNKKGNYDEGNIRLSLYRPFTKQWLYFDRQFNNMLYRMPKFFPTPKSKNFAISISGIGAGKDFSALMTNTTPDIQLQFNGQCFPLYYYEQPDGKLLKSGGNRRENIPDTTLKMFQKQYKSTASTPITKEDIFYYVYGVLHSPEYKKRYAADLKKMLPHIPYAKTLKHFQAFTKAGRSLADLHLNYESVAEYPLKEYRGGKQGEMAFDNPDYAVRKMRFAAKTGNRRELDKTAITYNETLTLIGIPLAAYEYQVNGKSAIEWVMDRYQKTVHKDSQIANDPNQYSDNPQYIVSLLKRVVYISVESVKIIKKLPQIND